MVRTFVDRILAKLEGVAQLDEIRIILQEMEVAVDQAIAEAKNGAAPPVQKEEAPKPVPYRSREDTNFFGKPRRAEGAFKTPTLPDSGSFSGTLSRKEKKE